MKTCSFFGHRTASMELYSAVKAAVTDMIGRGAGVFYVGNNGSFDRMARRAVKEIAGVYNLRVYVVLAYLPGNRKDEEIQDETETLYPEGLEIVPRRFAIIKRNEWMIDHSDYVVTYVNHDTGSGAARAKKTALARGKTVIDLDVYLRRNK